MGLKEAVDCRCSWKVKPGSKKNLSKALEGGGGKGEGEGTPRCPWSGTLVWCPGGGAGGLGVRVGSEA